MPNTLATPEIIAKEALYQLQSNLVMTELIHTDFSEEFAEVGDTINVRKPAVLKSKAFNGTITKQDLVETKVPVKMDRYEDVSVKITSKQQTLDIKDLSVQVIQPAMIALAEKVDQDIASFIYAKTPNTVTATASATDLKDIADLGKVLDKAKAPLTDRHLVLSPDHKYKYALTDNLSKVAYAGTNETLREALLGRIYSFNTYMDQNMPASSAPTAGTATAYKVASGSTDGEVALSSMSAATATVKAGDGFIYKNVVYRFTEDGTGTTSAIASIAVEPAFPTGVSTAVDAVLLPATSSLAFHRNAFAFVNRPLALPEGANKAAYASGNGISVRVVFGYDQDTKEDVISFDVIYGVAELRKELSAKLVGA